MKMEFSRNRVKCFYRETLFWLGMPVFIYLFQYLDAISIGVTAAPPTHPTIIPVMFIVFGLTKLIFCSTFPNITIDSGAITISDGITLLSDHKYPFSEITSVTQVSRGYYLVHLGDGRVVDISTELLSNADMGQVDRILRERCEYNDSVLPEKQTSHETIKARGLTCPACGEYHFRVMEVLKTGQAGSFTCPNCQSRLYKPVPVTSSAVLIVLLAQLFTEAHMAIAPLIIAGTLTLEFLLPPPRVLSPPSYKHTRWQWGLVLVFVAVLVSTMVFLLQPFLFGRIIFP